MVAGVILISEFLNAVRLFGVCIARDFLLPPSISFCTREPRREGRCLFMFGVQTLLDSLSYQSLSSKLPGLC